MKTTCLECGNTYDSDAVPKQPDVCPVCALAAFARRTEERLVKFENATLKLVDAGIDTLVERLKRLDKRLQDAEDWIVMIKDVSVTKEVDEPGFWTTDDAQADAAPLGAKNRALERDLTSEPDPED